MAMAACSRNRSFQRFLGIAARAVRLKDHEAGRVFSGHNYGADTTASSSIMAKSLTVFQFIPSKSGHIVSVASSVRFRAATARAFMVATKRHVLSSGDAKCKFTDGVRHFSSEGEPVHEKITMPALSPTMTQGNVATWKKKEGDKVSAGDVLCQIETDKATLDLEAMEDGFLAKILAPNGTKDLPVGTPLCIMVEEQDDIDKFASYSSDSSGNKQSQDVAPKKESPRPPLSSKEDDSSSAAPDVPYESITMPALSPTMTQGNLVKWKKSVGDKIGAGDVLCEIETDKATLDMEAMEDGFLAKVLVDGGTKDIPVGQPLCVVVEDEGDVEKFANFSGTPQKPSSSAPKQDVEKSLKSDPSETLETGPKKSRVGPSVRRYLAESGLDAASLRGTGPHGMLLKGDVLNAIKSGPQKSKSTSATAAEPRAAASTSKSSAPPAASDDRFTDIPTSQIRKIIAQRLLESKTGTPHLYLSAEAILDPTLELRKSLKETHGISVSVNDFVIRAAALALKAVPEANAFWDEKGGDVKPNESIDVSIAVATDKGLITPILKNADRKSLSEISAEVKSLAEKARAGKLKPQEFQGGTFSISNLGMYPVDNFSAVINPPQACILAVGRGQKCVTWEELREGEDRPVTVTKMSVTLSADHRVVDGDIAGRFLEALTSNLKEPSNMLL